MSNVSEVVPVVRARWSLPLTKPFVRLTVPLATRVFAPVATMPFVSARAPETVKFPVAPEKLTPLVLLTVRPEKVTPAPVIVWADVPLRVAVPPVAVKVPLLTMLPLMVWLEVVAKVVPEPTVRAPATVEAPAVFVPLPLVVRFP